MSNNEDTFRFKPETEHNKPQLDRSEFDEYSSARRNDEGESIYDEERDNGNRTLVILAVILSVLLVAAIAVGIFMLKPKKEAPPEDEIITGVEENIEEENNIQEEEPEKEKEPIILSCSMIFYSDSVISKSGKYLVKADLYDKDFYKFDSRKLTIDDNTEIREDGKRISADALIYLIEEAGGDSIVFDGEIEENEDIVLSLTFEKPILDEGEDKEDENSPEEDKTGEDVNAPEGEKPSVPDDSGNKETTQPASKPDVPTQSPAEAPTQEATVPTENTPTTTE